MVIYKIINTLNGKFYIGQTVQEPSVRFYQHTKNGRSNSTLYKAINKYGCDKFKIEILDTADSIDELNEKESFWIKELDSIRKGYNSRTGGRNSKHCKLSRDKMSKSHKGRIFSKEHRKNISEGIRSSEKAKNADKGNHFRKNNPQYDMILRKQIARKKWKPIYCINNKVTYLSLKHAAEDLPLRHSSITTALWRGNKIHGYKFYYIYKDRKQ